MQHSGPPQAISMPHLSDSYHRSRRNYGFFAILLVAWEFLGVEFTEISVSGAVIRIVNTEAIPYFLMAITIYHGYRTTLEWLQNDSTRRGLFASKADFYSAHLIGILAIVLYYSQNIFDFVLANVVLSETARRASLFAVLALVSSVIYSSHAVFHDKLRMRYTDAILWLVCVVLSILALYVSTTLFDNGALSNMALGAMLTSISFLALVSGLSYVFEGLESDVLLMGKSDRPLYSAVRDPSNSDAAIVHLFSCEEIADTKRIRRIVFSYSLKGAVAMAEAKCKEVKCCPICLPDSDSNEYS